MLAGSTGLPQVASVKLPLSSSVGKNCFRRQRHGLLLRPGREAVGSGDGSKSDDLGGG